VKARAKRVDAGVHGQRVGVRKKMKKIEKKKEKREKK